MRQPLTQAWVFAEYRTTYARTAAVFLLRREPFFHKLRYAKTPKFDLAAPLLGVIFGAFVGYVTLATFGSSGSDLSDLTVVVWYTGLVLSSLHLGLWLTRAGVHGALLGLPVTCFFIELCGGLVSELRQHPVWGYCVCGVLVVMCVLVCVPTFFFS